MDRQRRVEELFQSVLDLPREERTNLLKRACAEEHELQKEVEALLAHYSAADSAFLQKPPVVRAEEGELPSLLKQLGPYRLIRRVGEGGMGVVFEAEQAHPRRIVALKIIRPGLMSRSSMKRFQQESELLGRLQHPGIAQVFEAGTVPTDFGEQPFFAMEFIQGRPLTEYADQVGLGTRRRLELMARVCDAVQYAHEKGVIHRDLKPDNILVPHESPDQPKILDFGVARNMETNGGPSTSRTETGQLLGTLSYMSPEQITASPGTLDIRSDVYSLGVVLFELLGGRLPYDLTGRSLPEAGRVIREQEPSRLSLIDEAFRGDVESIVAKALEKEPSRRYSTAAELAADIRRFLKDEPIRARPAGTLYQLRKFTKRHKGLVGAAATVLATLLIAVIATSMALFRAKRAEALAVQRLDLSQRARAHSAAVTRFLQDMLASVDPGVSRGRDVTVREVLEQAVRQLESKKLADQPDIEAELRSTIGHTYLSLGLFGEAEPHLRTALENRRAAQPPDNPKIIESMGRLALLHDRRAEWDAAEALYLEALDLARKLHGEEHVEVASLFQNLAATRRARGDLDAAIPMYEASLAMRQRLLGPDHLDVAQSLNSQALVLQAQGKFQEAERICREAMRIRRMHLGDSHPEVAGSVNNLAYLVQMNGNIQEAESLYREALALRRELLGDEHPDIAQSLNNLAAVLHNRGKLAEAEPFYEQALALYRKRLGNDHTDVANCTAGLAILLRDRGDAASAEPLSREALAIRRKVLAPDHLDLAQSLAGLGLVCLDLKRCDEAESVLREAMAIRESKLPTNHWLIFNTMNLLGASLACQGRSTEAEPLLVNGLHGMAESPPFAARRRWEALERVIRFYEVEDKPDQAAQFRSMRPSAPE
jgi:tetratricopeptide (TPR) repeat protein/predicted Ser/Thr protein kinase